MTRGTIQHGYPMDKQGSNYLSQLTPPNIVIDIIQYKLKSSVKKSKKKTLNSRGLK